MNILGKFQRGVLVIVQFKWKGGMKNRRFSTDICVFRKLYKIRQ